MTRISTLLSSLFCSYVYRNTYIGASVTAWLLVVGCGAEAPGNSPATGDPSGGSGGGGAAGGANAGGSGDIGVGGFGQGGSGGSPSCIDAPPVPAGPEAVIAPAYAGIYTVYDLGVIPGMPSGHLGGSVLKQGDPDTLLVAGDSESGTGAIYSIGLKRGPCGHIIGWEGSAIKVADTPHVDANLVYGPNNVLFYTQWPVNQISQLLPGDTKPTSTLDGATMGINTGDSVSGFGFVPPWLAAAGQPRTVTWSGGHWFHLTIGGGGPTYSLSNGQEITVLSGGPGGFAYIPKGSPGFPKPSLILSEWSIDKVATYEVDDQGDPIPATRADFFTAFPRPWGAYFESKTGDFLFLTWGSLPDRVYLVQGFALPPPPPDPPK